MLTLLSMSVSTHIGGMRIDESGSLLWDAWTEASMFRASHSRFLCQLHDLTQSAVTWVLTDNTLESVIGMTVCLTARANVAYSDQICDVHGLREAACPTLKFWRTGKVFMDRPGCGLSAQ